MARDISSNVDADAGYFVATLGPHPRILCPFTIDTVLFAGVNY